MSSYSNAVGRLYAVMPDGQSISACTATVVGANVVMTAAHCVYDISSGLDDLQFLFLPGMDGTYIPLGGWAGTTAYYWSDFQSTPETSIDYAFVSLAPNSAGQNVGDATGAYQILENVNPRSLFSEGYPASGPYASSCGVTSCYATFCSAPLAATWQDDFGGQLGMGCRTGHGASGGPWFTRYQQQSVVASVTSTGVMFRGWTVFRNIWGPQFDSSLGELLQQAENG
jgi:V8-like Glu-specific endopeptidase